MVVQALWSTQAILPTSQHITPEKRLCLSNRKRGQLYVQPLKLYVFPVSISTYSHVKTPFFSLDRFFLISWSPDIPICKSELVLPHLSPSFVGALQVQCDVTQGSVASQIFGHSNFNEWFPFFMGIFKFFCSVCAEVVSAGIFGLQAPLKYYYHTGGIHFHLGQIISLHFTPIISSVQSNSSKLFTVGSTIWYLRFCILSWSLNLQLH